MIATPREAFNKLDSCSHEQAERPQLLDTLACPLRTAQLPARCGRKRTSPQPLFAYDFYVPSEVFIVKISLERDVLLAQLQTVSRVASTRSAIQALSGVQLGRVDGACELRATDMDVGLRVPLEAEIVARGRRGPACAAAARRRPLAAGAERLARAARCRAGRRARVRQRDLPHPNAAHRGLPAVPRAGPGLGGLAVRPRRSSRPR